MKDCSACLSDLLPPSFLVTHIMLLAYYSTQLSVLRIKNKKQTTKFFFNNYADMLESITYLHTPNTYSLIDTKSGIHCSVESDEYTVQKNIKKDFFL